MMRKLEHKVAVVTGASKGIGAQIAKSLAAEGAAVIVNYASDKLGAEKVVAAILAGGGQAIAIKGDITKSAEVERLFAAAKIAFGNLDILVNNAGVFEFRPIEAMTEEHYRQQFDTNVLGLLLSTRAAIKSFGERGGSVINISSAVTQINPPMSVVYTASKSAVDAITLVLSKELGSRGIRVNAINPGMIETEGARAAGFIGSQFQMQAEQQAPLKRIGQTGDIAPIAVFLASDDARWLTGEILVASGGLR